MDANSLRGKILKVINSYLNWLNSTNWQVDFYQRADQRHRTDPNSPWAMVDEVVGSDHLEWLNSNAEPLWESRSLLNDELSKLLFDATLVLRLSGHRRFYFPRIDFDDLIEIVDEKPFNNADLPSNYVGLPLKLYDIQLREHPMTVPLKLVTSKENLILINSYRQYLVRRNSIDISPARSDTVFDCSACIGDISLIFAGLVDVQGEVHLFDPIPLHARFCRLHASLNPSLAHILHVNELAVSNSTYVRHGHKSDSDQIAPAGLVIDSFASTSLDDYAQSKQLSRVDFIKMDIEGAEMDALNGASEIIREFKPKLAISAYHKDQDLWGIPIKLKSLNPGNELYYGHHSPIRWESVFYAVQQ
jgi:FkbM family methyltransferase